MVDIKPSQPVELDLLTPRISATPTHPPLDLLRLLLLAKDSIVPDHLALFPRPTLQSPCSSALRS